ncbi:DUF6630 family protein [Kibdelosporangium phytohabitans]|uniref:DUF6630 domain-containing protein n=1 Tax=Kibdelosporangium phytohabitans TaxID=860235 RepID=A0A0N9I4Q8_9PSEU|nr:DUF6630 family protein [Kibdelosporangium phytohabitans]ALG09362.1 hypothetical protein AOZ06_22815 [Kibdelosporangium phytohabitans]MBE1469370.1 hypothetical protein [Kibdelosporangium phytohabitans]
MPPTAREALTAIAELLAPGNPDVTDRVVHAHSDPDSYLRAHADQLDERGIDEPIPNLARIALVDALTGHGLLAEVDWKEDADEIVAQLKRLRSSPAQPGAWVWFTGGTGLDTYGFLELAGSELHARGTALAVIDIESDCYPLVLLPADQLTGQQSGHLVHVGPGARLPVPDSRVQRGGELAQLAAAAGFTAEPVGCHPQAMTRTRSGHRDR